MKNWIVAITALFSLQALAMDYAEVQSCTLKIGSRQWTSTVNLNETSGTDASDGQLYPQTFSVQNRDEPAHVGVLNLTPRGKNSYDASVEDFGSPEIVFGMRVGEKMSVGPVYYDSRKRRVAKTKKFKIFCTIVRS